jgi:hypothetical protein
MKKNQANPASKPLTKSQVKALTILKGTTYHKPMSPVAFARLMWPLSNMHTKSSNQGNGATRGKAAWLCAGSYIAVLRKKNLVDNFLDVKSNYGYYITSTGLERLEEFEKTANLKP